jgi:hypothetical protein
MPHRTEAIPSRVGVYRRKTDTVSIGDWGSIAERHPSWE